MPALYPDLTIVLAGVAAAVLLQFTYMYLKLRQKDTSLLLVFSCASFVYIISDACAVLFSGASTGNSVALFFMYFRETGVLAFIIILQYYISSIPVGNGIIQKLNAILLYCAAAAVLILVALVLYEPSLLLKQPLISPYNPGTVHIAGSDMGPLLIIRNILMMAYSAYSIIIIVLYGLTKQEVETNRYMTAGIIIIMYFISFYLYFIIFAPDNIPACARLPYLSLGLAACLIFVVCGRMKTLADRYTQLESDKTILEYSIYNDMSLNIPGRIAFQKDLQYELERLLRNNETMFLIFLDIDDFGSLNECYGESFGDEILKMLADRISELFSRSGSLYRIGGDEFGFVLWDTKSPEEATDLAEKFITCLRNPFHVYGVTCMITASAAVLQIPNDGKDVDSVFSNAYRTIGNAKKTKNRYEIFSSDLLDITSRKIHIVNTLRNSISKDEFALYYQPIVDSDKKIVHAESLLRYTGKDLSIGGPGVFLPILEDAGLMKEIDNMVTQKAFHDMELKIGNRFSISINLSTVQLVDPAYCRFLSSFAAQHGIKQSQIVLEVTEDRLMENISSGRESIARLKENGFKIAIDDFGKGFSSLTYLAELPVDILKMDMVFTQSVPGDRRKESMVKHIIDLAHSLGLKVVAEGFQTEEQFQFFRSLGCDLFQGYYFARPVPLDELMSKFFNVQV